MCVHLKTFNESFRTWAEAREDEQDFPSAYGGVMVEDVLEGQPETNPLVPVAPPLITSSEPATL